jgi:guanyl-specific ribonuclease Sa
MPTTTTTAACLELLGTHPGPLLVPTLHVVPMRPGKPPWRRRRTRVFVMAFSGLIIATTLSACGGSRDVIQSRNLTDCSQHIGVECPGGARAGQIPQNAQDVLKEIESNGGSAPPGYVGGGPFHNNEGSLPATNTEGNPITYREYDVHPHRKGVNRGPERIVIGSNGTAYYTNDHYQSFVPFP